MRCDGGRVAFLVRRVWEKKTTVINPTTRLGTADSPLLNLVESLEHGHGDKDDDGLFPTLDVDLFGGRDGELLQLGLELGDVGLQVQDGLGDGLFDLVGGTGRGVGGSLNFGSVRGHDDCGDRGQWISDPLRWTVVCRP